MTPGIAERERIAERLRRVHAEFDTPRATVRQIVYRTALELGVSRNGTYVDMARKSLSRLADLVDPSAWRAVVEDNERLLERCRELEKENYALKSGGCWRGGRS